MRTIVTVLLAGGLSAVTLAQQVPDINDVYVTERLDDTEALGPGEAVVDRFATWLRAGGYVAYDFVLSSDETSDGLRGTVAVDRGRRGRANRYRIDVKGSLPGVGVIDAEFGSDRRGFYVIDRTEQTERRFEDRSQAPRYANLAHQLLISELPTGTESVAGIAFADNRTDRIVHLVDPLFAEHLYLTFADSPHPIAIDRIMPGPANRPTRTRLRIVRLRKGAD